MNAFTIEEKDDMLVISGKCPITGEVYSVQTKPDDYASFLAGNSTEKCFPYLSVDDRLFLLTSFSPKGWRL